MPEFIFAVCQDCGHRRPFAVRQVTCPKCGSEFAEAEYPLDAREGLLAEWRNRDIGLRRFGPLLPLREPERMITLGEGDTPLIPLDHIGQLLGHPKLYAKDERQSPTASFKDRQAALAVSAMKEAGLTEAVVSSTGNVAIAYAAYCARAGIRLTAFLTPTVPADKMRECALYGAHIIKATTSYDASKKLALRFAEERGLFYDRGLRSIPSLESMKTIAFEIAEQLAALERRPGAPRYVAPDWYVQSISGGLGPIGVGKGFRELHGLGLIDRLPKLGIIQAAGCAPMVTAFKAGKAQADPVVPKTLITVLATGDPGFSYEQLRAAVLQTGGTMRAIEDGETFAAMRKIASKAGLSVEPATAVAFAGLEQLLSDGTIQQDEVVVVNCSGHTFPAESHVLGDQFLHSLELEGKTEGLGAAFSQLDEQVTTILVVDDNPNDRRLIRRMLTTRKQYRVFEAQDGADALRVIGEQAPNLIVTDLTMPGMDGFTLLERLKADARTAAIPVVVLSAKSLDAADKDLLERFSESVWTKGDFETRALVDHIVTALKNESS